MKIAVLSSDASLMESLTREKANALDELEFFPKPRLLAEALDEKEERYRFIVLSDRFFDCDGLGDYVDVIRETCPETILIVLLSNCHNSGLNEKNLKFCLSRQLLHIHPGRTVNMLTRQIYSFIYGEQTQGSDKGKIVLFLGSTPNIGTTLVSFGTAARLAISSESTVGYLCLNLKSSKIHRYLGIDDPVVTLDGLRAELRARSLKKERLRQYCAAPKNARSLHVLFGNLLREQAEFYSPEDIEHLLQTARSAFDLCIVEVNAYWDNAATVSAILQADMRLLVTTGEITHFQEDVYRWLQCVGPVFHLDASSFDLVVNQGKSAVESGGLHLRDIRKETGMHMIASVSGYPEISAILNHGKMMELFTGEHPIVRELDGIVQSLIARYGLGKTQLPAKTKAGWLARLRSGVKAT